MTQRIPNLVFIFPDQFRQQAIGCMNQDPVVTPNLDRFASESIVFTNAVSNYPVCSPCRAMLFTGKYPHSNGVITNCNSETAKYDIFLRESEQCLSDVLHDAGYNQGYIGKFHLDAPSEANYQYTEGKRGDGMVWDAYTPPGPRRHGFDFWHSSYGCCDWHFKPHYWEGDAKVDERIDIDEWSVKHETDVAVDYIRNRDGKYRHHVRLKGNGASAREHAKNYFATVTGIDENFGRILNSLEEESLQDDTIVIFSADMVR